jgi:alkanesulfonate monooxygenase SsuD/methylene tetrahydromethanopterin reductase-like flavin-dependent oxidoreductase (luciferase family)
VRWSCEYLPNRSRATYDTLLAVMAAEDAGFGAYFRSDHYLKMGSVDGQPGPTDAWITLAGLARDTTTIRLGTLMTAATFRLPGPLAIAVAQVDAMRRRVELGPAGWFTGAPAYGIPFLQQRASDRYEEQLRSSPALRRRMADVLLRRPSLHTGRLSGVAETA